MAIGSRLGRLALVLLLAAGGSAAVAGPVLDKIVAEGTVRFGFRTDATRFAELVDGRPRGFTVDLCALVAKAVKETAGLERITAEFAPVDTDRRFEAIAKGEIDVLCGATTATLSRRETVSFSLPVFHTGLGVAMTEAAPARARDLLLDTDPTELTPSLLEGGLTGLAFGVRSDTTAGEWLERSGIAGLQDITIAEFPTHDIGIAALRAGEIDGYFADQAILLGQLVRLGDDSGLLLSPHSFTDEPYALALPRGDDDFRLLIDRALSRLYRTDAVIALMERHFGPVDADVRLFYRMMAQPE